MRQRWPEAECLHEHRRGEAHITNGVGHLIRIVADQCLDCGKRFPIGDVDTPPDQF